MNSYKAGPTCIRNFINVVAELYGVFCPQRPQTHEIDLEFKYLKMREKNCPPFSLATISHAKSQENIEEKQVFCNNWYRGIWAESAHFLIGKFTYFVIRFLYQLFFVINFSYLIIRFLLNSSIVKSNNEIGKFWNRKKCTYRRTGPKSTQASCFPPKKNYFRKSLMTLSDYLQNRIKSDNRGTELWCLLYFRPQTHQTDWN